MIKNFEMQLAELKNDSQRQQVIEAQKLGDTAWIDLFVTLIKENEVTCCDTCKKQAICDLYKHMN